MRVVFAPSPPYPTVSLHPSKKLLPTNARGRNTIMTLFEEFKGKDTFFESERIYGWGRKALKNSARYLKANINFVFCVIIKRNQFNLIVFAV